jgi:hypothetical protein
MISASVYVSCPDAGPRVRIFEIVRAAATMTTAR